MAFFKKTTRHITIAAALFVLAASYGCNDNADKASAPTSADSTDADTGTSAPDSSRLVTPDSSSMRMRHSGEDTGRGVVNPRPATSRQH